MEKEYNPLEDLLGIEPEEVDASAVEQPITEYNPLEDLLGSAEQEQEEEVRQEDVVAKEEIDYNPLEDLESDDSALLAVEDPTEYDLDVEKTFDEFAADQGYIDSIKEYAVSRYGAEQAAELDDKSNEEIVELFLTEVRAFETNSINLTSMIDYVRGANEEDKANLGFIYSQLDKMPGFLSEGGGSATSGLIDYIGQFISDPINLVGFGAGRVAASGAKAAYSSNL